MSKDWTQEERAAASDAMKAAGHMSYDEFCVALKQNGFNGIVPDSSIQQLKPPL